MKDIYSLGRHIPEHCVVPPQSQPDYLDVAEGPGNWIPSITGPWNVGYQLADGNVEAGRGNLIAAINSSTGEQYTFDRLARESTRLAAGLVELGVEPGERVAYCSPNDPETLIVMLAIWKSGAILVPVPVNLRRQEMSAYVDDVTPKFVFAHVRSGSISALLQMKDMGEINDVFLIGESTGRAQLQSWRDIALDDEKFCADVSRDQPAIIWHTGGTTGRPKGCYHTHRRFLLAGYSYGDGADVSPGQRWCAAAPIGHALGIIHSTIFTMLHGATVVFVETFSDALLLLEAVDEHQISVLTALTVSWGKMASAIKGGARWNGSSLNRAYAMWQTASAAEIFDFWQARGLELFNNFGSTAFANWILIPPAGSIPPRSALGKPQTGYSVAAVELLDGTVRELPTGEIGRLAVRGVSGLTYWNLPEIQARDVVEGWTVCDDLVKIDAEGFAHYLGRSDYMISTAGFKVAPAEVEQVLSEHPAVLEVAVVPAPCPIRMEQIAAFIVPINGNFQPDVLSKELVDLVSSKLSPYKVPRRVEFVASLPRDGVGKVQTKVVKAWASDGGQIPFEFHS